jgi:hypothetical protein
LTGIAIVAELVIAKTTIKQIKFLKLITLLEAIFSLLLQFKKVVSFFSKPLTVVFCFSPFVLHGPSREGINKKAAVPAKETAALIIDLICRPAICPRYGRQPDSYTVSRIARTLYIFS